VKLNNFKIADDNIAFEYRDKYFDLHNCFDFVSLNYDISQKLLKLFWIKTEGDWVSIDSPKNIVLIVSDVYLFKTKERDKDKPYTEDDCLSSIGFVFNEEVDKMGGYFSNVPEKDCTHLSLEFESGFVLKIGAKYLEISVN